MEKISRIVRGNARVATVDNKSAAPARPGMPAFGRPMGESTPVSAKASSTASRAVALHKGLREAKEAASQERAIGRLADEFFMSRVRRPGDEPAAVETAPGTAPDIVAAPQIDEGVDAPSTEELMLDGGSVETPKEAREYTPRGSYVDVHA
jgi:hypothetical protein